MSKREPSRKNPTGSIIKRNSSARNDIVAMFIGSLYRLSVNNLTELNWNRANQLSHNK